MFTSFPQKGWKIDIKKLIIAVAEYSAWFSNLSASDFYYTFILILIPTDTSP